MSKQKTSTSPSKSHSDLVTAFDSATEQIRQLTEYVKLLDKTIVSWRESLEKNKKEIYHPKQPDC